MFYHLYNQIATNTVERVAPLTHVVGNVLKRVFVDWFLYSSIWKQDIDSNWDWYYNSYCRCGYLLFNKGNDGRAKTEGCCPYSCTIGGALAKKMERVNIH